MKQKFITHKNVQLAFSSYGKGNTIVLLHGFLENSTMWRNYIPTLSKRNRVVCIDLLGHGNSECLGYVHSMDEMASAVKSVLNFLKIRKIMLIGHSMGGYVSLAFAEMYPKMIKSICLLNSTAQADNEERKSVRKKAIKMAQINYESLVIMSINNLFTADTRKQFLSEIEDCKKQALKTSVQGYIACTEGMRLRPNREDVLNSLEIKKIHIIGKKDPILNVRSVVEEAKRTNTPIFMLSNGHMSHIENEIELKSILVNFIKKT